MGGTLLHSKALQLNYSCLKQSMSRSPFPRSPVVSDIASGLVQKPRQLHSALICGLARQCGDAMSKSLQHIEALRKSFSASEVIFVTNDSTDTTENNLREWCKSSPGSVVLSVDGLIGALPSRTDRIAAARNFYLLELKNRISAGLHYDLVIVIDLDGVNDNLIDGPEFLDALSGPPADWAAVFANQRQAYYDIWALRHETWCPSDCWKEVRAAAHRVSRWAPRGLRGRFNEYAAEKAKVRFVGIRQIHIPQDSPPIRVESAFGGIGIYRTSWLSDLWYGGRDNDGNSICEHVILNQQIHRRGGKLYILPQLLNDTPVDHLQPGAGSNDRPWECAEQNQLKSGQ